MIFRSTILKVKAKYVFVLIAVCYVLYVFGIFTHLFEKDYSTFKYPYDGVIFTAVLQLRNNQVPEIKPINSYNYEFIRDCQQKCKIDGDLIQLRLVYIIKSSPENFERRAVIRKTWGYERRFSNVEIRTVFVLGIRNDLELHLKVNNESKHFNDIVQANFVDSYYNNTLKTMTGIKWVTKYCSNSKFYMFVDDDYYVSTKNVLRFVRNPAHYPEYLLKEVNGKFQIALQTEEFQLLDDVKLFSGYVFVSAPHRHMTSKWYVSLDDYPYNYWPPYVTAGAYILSREALLDMYYTSFYTQHFKFDDIYLGLLAKKANIEPLHCDEFHFYKNMYKPHRYRFTIASHGYESPLELLQVWIEQKSLGNA